MDLSGGARKGMANTDHALTTARKTCVLAAFPTDHPLPK
jgi:hypothetical protein